MEGKMMDHIEDWLKQGFELAEARTYAPFTAKPDEYGEKIVLKSGGYSLRTGEWGDNGTIQPTANANYVNHAIQALPQALNAIQAVLDLHEPTPVYVPEDNRMISECSHCHKNYPCETVEKIQDSTGLLC